MQIRLIIGLINEEMSIKNSYNNYKYFELKIANKIRIDVLINQ